MPVLMRGGGGSKKTKDATALPEDVRSGKTFYGKDGKQTGIWTPKVIDFTGDATAVPSDVMTGKVFYNNNGRQVGSGENFKSVTINLIGSGTVTVPSINNVYRARYFTNGMNVCLSEMSGGNGFPGGCAAVNLPSFYALIAVKINGMYFPLPTTMQDVRRNIIMRSYMNDTDDLDFYILEDGRVGLLNGNNQKISMTVYYI